MNGESALYAAMSAQVAPTPVWRLHAPQADDQHPVQTPYVIFSRELFGDSNIEDFCAADTDLADAYLVDCIHHTYAGARELSRQMTAVFKAFNAPLESSFEDYDPAMRVYRISSSYTLRT